MMKRTRREDGEKMTPMAETVAERIALALAERIVTGELPPGAALRQDRIAQEFGSSHVPVREAFQLLRSQWLAVSEPRRGVRVAPLDRAAMQEIVEIRAALETLALTYAAAKLTPGCVERIERAMLACEQAQTLEDWEQANRNFHRELAAPCRMPRLLEMLDELQRAGSRVIFSVLRATAWQPTSNQAHRQIVAALKAGDPARAAELLQHHIRGLERPGPGR